MSDPDPFTHAATIVFLEEEGCRLRLTEDVAQRLAQRLDASALERYLQDGAEIVETALQARKSILIPHAKGCAWVNLDKAAMILIGEGGDQAEKAQEAEESRLQEAVRQGVADELERRQAANRSLNASFSGQIRQ